MYANIVIVLLTFELGNSDLFKAKQFPVKFLVYSRHKPLNVNFTQTPSANNQAKIAKSNIDGSLHTKIITNGYKSIHDDCEWSKKMRDEFLNHFNYNVVLVDWSAGSAGLYNQARANTHTAANAIANFIEVLQKTKKLSLDNVHLIGHSLGAHISGLVGHALNGSIGRITGLDPAGPFYNGKHNADKLNHTNAQFVDVIHSNSLKLHFDRIFGFGIIENAGHLDFWPNGGFNHPGCLKSCIPGTEKFDLEACVSCNHARAAFFYVDTINPNKPEGEAHECESYDLYKKGECNAECDANEANCAIIGEKAVLSKPYTDTTKNKKFYLITNSLSPYFSK